MKFKQLKRSPEEWEDVAIDAIESVGTSPQLLAVAGLAGGAVVAGLSPIAALGLVPVALGLKAAVDVNNKRSRMETAIEQGAIAAVLPLPELKAYAQQFGTDAVIEQIQWAKGAGIPLSEDSEALLGRYQQKVKALPKTASAEPQTVDVEAVQSGEGQQGAIASTVPTNPAELLERLKAECPVLLKLVKAPPIRIVGHQRTGKSTFARIILLLRMLFLSGHQVKWATPHVEPDDPVPPQLNPFGNPMNYPAIEAVWKETQAALGYGKLNLSIVWDEFGGYDRFEDLSLLGESLRSLLRDSSKHEYYPILIAHGDQASFYPGVAGILTTLKAGTVKIETIGEPINDFGEMRPTGKAKITHLDGNSADIELPKWLTDKYLIGLLPTPVAVEPASVPPAPAQAIAPTADQAAAATAATAPEPEDTYQTADQESAAADQAVKKIAVKLREKIRSKGADWIHIHELSRDLFCTPEDRKTARQIIENAVAKGQLESEERENPNKTRSLFVRLKPADSANKNPS